MAEEKPDQNSSSTHVVSVSGPHGRPTIDAFMSLSSDMRWYPAINDTLASRLTENQAHELVDRVLQPIEPTLVYEVHPVAVLEQRIAERRTYHLWQALRDAVACAGTTPPSAEISEDDIRRAAGLLRVSLPTEA